MWLLHQAAPCCFLSLCPDRLVASPFPGETLFDCALERLVLPSCSRNLFPKRFFSPLVSFPSVVDPLLRGAGCPLGWAALEYRRLRCTHSESLGVAGCAESDRWLDVCALGYAFSLGQPGPSAASVLPLSPVPFQLLHHFEGAYSARSASPDLSRFFRLFYSSSSSRRDCFDVLVFFSPPAAASGAILSAPPPLLGT